MGKLKLYRGQPVFSAGAWLPTLSHLGDRRAVALTFDDGPHPETTPALLDLLSRHGAKATFFVTGERAVDAPHLVARLVHEGHDVFAHAWTHERLQGRPAAEVHDQLERTERFLARFRPTPELYFVRLPYASGLRDPATHRAIAAWRPDAQLAAWRYATRDDQLPFEARDMDDLARRCDAEVARLLARPRLAGAVLLTHECGYDVQSPFNAPLAPMLLARLLPGLREKGLRVERLIPRAAPSPLSRCVLSVAV